MLPYHYMKKLILGAAALLLRGAGCASGGQEDGQPYRDESTPGVVEQLGPRPAYPGDDPAMAVQSVWADFVYAVDGKRCDKMKALLTPELQVSFTDLDCQAAIELFKVVQGIDWSKTETSADKKTVTLKDYDGGVYAVYLLREDGAWYLNTKIWVM